MGSHIHMDIFYGVCISKMDACDDEPIPQLTDRYEEVSDLIDDHPDFRMITLGYMEHGYNDEYLAIDMSVRSLYEAFHLNINPKSLAETDTDLWDKLLAKFCHDNCLPITDGQWIVGASYG